MYPKSYFGGGQWRVEIADEFVPELRAMEPAVRDALSVTARLLAAGGPTLGRPWVDTLTGTRIANLKELRFRVAGGVWRVAFAFDPRRRAILLVAGDKAGGSSRRFYRWLVDVAEERWQSHLRRIVAND